MTLTVNALISGVLLCLVLILGLGATQKTHAATIWTGPDTNFTQSASDFSDELVPGAVSLCRNYAQWLFNFDVELGPGAGTPTDTEWAFGSLVNYGTLHYQTFDSLRNGDLSDLLVGNPMVVHLINEDIYLSLTFYAWPQNGGFFAYTRSTPAAVGLLPLTLSSPKITSGHFAFDYAANPGLIYVVQSSSNLVNWLSVVTNVPSSNSVHFTDSFTPKGARYYRVARMLSP